MDVLDDLAFRGYIFQMTDEDKLRRRLAEGQMTLYCGFDPTADSLHAGSLVPIMGLRRFQDAGHKPIALVGGGTGLIGDPSGKAEERQLNSLEVVQAYTESQRAQLEKYLDFEAGHNPALMVSNYTWLSELRTIEFLRDVGKHFSIGYMLGKEAVSSRLSTGISFTEFSYMVLQAYDFMALNREYGCELQIGGSDQWGNITAGIELCRRVLNKTVYGLTFPLLEKSDGTKFGKTETGTLWLDPEKTSPYQFYQFWVNVADRDVVKFLKLFTFLSRERIEELEREVEARPEKREAQRVLAEEVTTFIHGAAAKDRAVHISEALFYGNLRDLNEQEIAEGFSVVLSYTLKGVDEVVLIDLLVDARISSSRRQAREDIRTGAIYINGERCTDMSHVLKPSERLAGKYLVIRRGKRSYFLVSWPA
ncbi:MAG: tyrosine--tRNA ligase [Gemmatimonadetes bacterium]|nr:tyrosine--tRNA ligase [Gemmatimonadota bacterium]